MIDFNFSPIALKIVSIFQGISTVWNSSIVKTLKESAK